MNQDLEKAHNTNAELTTTIAELESQLDRLRAIKEPFSSTPYHPGVSLHEEMLGQDRTSPVPQLNFESEMPNGEDVRTSRTTRREVHVSATMSSLTKLLDDTVCGEDSITHYNPPPFLKIPLPPPSSPSP